MITAADIQDRISDGVAALDAGDYAAALLRFEAAAALMSGVPDIKSLESEIAWKPEQLDAVISRTRRLARKAAGGANFVQQPIEKDLQGWRATS